VNGQFKTLFTQFKAHEYNRPSIYGISFVLQISRYQYVCINLKSVFSDADFSVAIVREFPKCRLADVRESASKEKVSKYNVSTVSSRHIWDGTGVIKS